MMSLLDIASIHELPSISIEFVLAFIQYDLDVYVFMYLPLGIGLDVNLGEWVQKSNIALYGTKQAIENWFDLLKLV